jgi:N-methylhydantoinase B
MNNITIGGLKGNGEPWTFYETIGGGSGGRPNKDGVDGIHVNMTNTMNTPIETLEAYLPLKFKSYMLREDSGGPLKYRGGCGIERSWTLTSVKATLSIMAERSKINPWGLKGGHGGAKGEYILIHPDGTTSILPSKCTVQITQGDTFIIKTPGGGGYGDPKERPPEMIREDIMNGFVSFCKAREIYRYKENL